MEQGYDYKESEKQHQKEQKPILDERFAYINKRQLEYASKLKMGKVITYAMRYVGRPAMAESRIIKYSKTEDTIEWFYHDHKDEVKHIVKEDSKSFIKKLLIHIPDENFRSVRYYGFYSNKAGEELDHVHELLVKRNTEKEKMLNKLKYRTHLIDSFNRDPLKCRLVTILNIKIHTALWKE